MNERGLRLRVFDSQEMFFDEVRSNYRADYCFGLELSDVRHDIEEVNITMLYPRDLAPNTFRPLYDLSL